MTTDRQLLSHKMMNHGSTIFLIGMVFAFIETWYFGSNWYPESIAEFKCDIISAKIVGSGWGIMIYAFYLRLTTKP